MSALRRRFLSACLVDYAAEFAFMPRSSVDDTNCQLRAVMQRLEIR